jgi:hypothetical protein
VVRKIYKPNKPKNNMTKQKKYIFQVKVNKNKQKRITIPQKVKEIKGYDYVELKKLKD